MTGHPRKGDPPYPGLRFYKDHQAEFFAGRHEESKQCTRLLGDSHLLILHGRTGCGKSSFLRAGVKPMLERADPGSAFSRGNTGFEVVRSTSDPLSQFSVMLFRACEELVANKKTGFWRKKDAVEEADLAEFKKSIDANRANIRTKGRHAIKALTELSKLLKSAPVFVIDQAEEVFTLYEKKERQRDRSEGMDERNLIQKELDALTDSTGEFFQFLGMLSEKGARGARVVISLRTEYKGLFDDKLAATRMSTERIKGYYLPDLSLEGLIEAIKRPTKDKKEWQQLREQQSIESQNAPYDRFGFKFDEGVAELLASKLTNSEDVPSGGALPTLQVTCLRLWQQAEQASVKGRDFTITQQQLGRLGEIHLQVQEFVSEQLKGICQAHVEWVVGHTTAVKRWRRILKENLVEVQADGRAVSGTVSRDELIAVAVKEFSGDEPHDKLESVIDTLSAPSSALLLVDNTTGMVSLGHDSVALALSKWGDQGQADVVMMKRMNTSSSVLPHEMKREHLFPEGQMPHETEIVVHRDLHWDRQFPHFAEREGFAERLGIKFITDIPKLDATQSRYQYRSKNWRELAQNLKDEERAAYRARTRKENSQNRRVMVAADSHSFPTLPADEEAFKKLSKAEQDEWKIDQTLMWTDVLVTDLFTGNGLIGPRFSAENETKDATDKTIEERGKIYRSVISEALKKVVAEKGVVGCHDELAVRFLQRSAALACADDPSVVAYFQKSANVVRFGDRDYVISKDPLVDWFQTPAEETDGRPRFIVGTAASRAHALQAGATLYYHTSHLTLFARAEINRLRRAAKKKKNKKKIGELDEKQQDLGKLIQEVIKHTTWQLGMAPTQWNQGRNRAMVLRLASVGYFTSEYIRTNADEFVNFIQDWINDYLGDAKYEAGTYRGMRMNQDSVREAVKECYGILRFDEYGSEFYDLDSTTAYWTEHAKFESRSVAGEIYNELSMLRQRTIANYETVSRIIGWMRGRDIYDVQDKEIEEAITLKELAWNNFRIFNFYDSARLMAAASQILQIKMEEVDDAP